MWKDSARSQGCAPRGAIARERPDLGGPMARAGSAECSTPRRLTAAAATLAVCGSIVALAVRDDGATVAAALATEASAKSRIVVPPEIAPALEELREEFLSTSSQSSLLASGGALEIGRLDSGRRVFERYCAGCHGASGDGQGT